MGKSLSDIIQLARKMETDGIKFYADAALKAANPQAKRLFESFSEDEERHLGIIGDIAKGIGVNVDDMSMPKESIQTAFSQTDAQARERQQVTADETRAIEIAMEMERDSYRVYQNAGSEAEDQTHKSLFGRLASEENQHYEMLENTQQYLGDTQKWFLWNEWGLLTGDLSSLGQ